MSEFLDFLQLSFATTFHKYLTKIALFLNVFLFLAFCKYGLSKHYFGVEYLKTGIKMIYYVLLVQKEKIKTFQTTITTERPNAS